MRDEHNARVMLERRWASISAEHRHTCAAETTVGGGKPSYVEVLTCIEMYAGSPSSTVPMRRD